LGNVIVNTSPLQYLYQAGQLDLLPKLFRKVVVTEAVAAELAAGREVGVSLPDPKDLEWVDFRRPVKLVSGLFSLGLGAGESSVLSLALENPGSWVVLDDRLARQVAIHLNIPLLGTAGILLRAKNAGHLSAVHPVLKQLVSLGFRLRPETVRDILDLAAE
jgi:predicted nucleic acid-binding protein